MFSKACEYGIRAMIFIAHKSKTGTKTGIKEIAYETQAPEPFIAKILQDLSRKDLVQSLKGATGGFYFEKNQTKCSLADIVKAIDGDKLFTGCGLGFKECSEKKPCPIHNEFKRIRNDIHTMLKNEKLDDLSENLEQRLSFLKRK